jgi:hypothetical protein
MKNNMFFYCRVPGCMREALPPDRIRCRECTDANRMPRMRCMADNCCAQSDWPTSDFCAGHRALFAEEEKNAKARSV